MQQQSLRQSVRQSGPSSPGHKSLLVSNNGSPLPSQQRQNIHHKTVEDAEYKQLVNELEQLTGQTRDKERKIERLIEQNNRIAQENSEMAKESQRLAAQIQEAKANPQQNGNSAMEQEEKSEGEDIQEMKQFMIAIKMQSQGLSTGLTSEAIDLIPSFSYEKALEPEICLSCYQELENNTNVKCLPCCHLFHAHCIQQHLGQSRFCPACSEEVVLA